MVWRADARTNKIALAARPKPVTVVRAKRAMYRPTRTYVGTLQPWIQANVGPQLISAYVDTVLVRPGATSSGRARSWRRSTVARPAPPPRRSPRARGRSMPDSRRSRTRRPEPKGLLNGGFVSPNEAEQKTAQSDSEAAGVESERANLARSSLDVNDCIMRAPFNGEIAQRSIDPGAFVRPGTTIVTVVDRDTVRMTADAPEMDFDVVPAGTKVAIHVYATNRDLIRHHHPPLARRRSRRPARFTSRSILPIPTRAIPVGTTGEVRIEVGEPMAATEIPLYAATVAGTRRRVFVVDNGLAEAHTVAVKGEAAGSLFLDSAIVARGRIGRHRRGAVAPRADGDAVDLQAGREPSADRRPRRRAPVRHRATSADDLPLASKSDRHPDDLRRAGGLRRGGHAAHERRHLPRADAARAHHRDAGAGPRTEGRGEDDQLAAREVRLARRPASITSRARRATASRSSTSG